MSYSDNMNVIMKKESNRNRLSRIQNGGHVDTLSGSSSRFKLSSLNAKKSESDINKEIREFNEYIMKYTRASNNYNDELIKNNVASPGSMRNLIEVNHNLVDKALKIYFMTNIINGVDENGKRAIELKRRELYRTIQELKDQQEKLKYSRRDDKTMNASFEDIKRMSDSTNIRYMLFLLGIVLLLIMIVKINRM